MVALEGEAFSIQGLLAKTIDDPRGLDIGLAGAPLVKAVVALL